MNDNSVKQWQRYPAYKDSGVEWLGEVPEHWEVRKLKHNSYVKGRIGWQNLRSSEFTDEGPYLITGMHFKDGSVDWDACYHITEERYNIAPEIQVKPDDVLITKDGSIGKLAYISDLPGKASLNSHLLIIRPLHNKYLPRYLYHLLGSQSFNLYVLLTQTGTTFYGITQESIVNFSISLPPLPEQQAIAQFLDRETAKIDTLIAKKERLIELLKEKRTALISHAVTKGLNPNTPMKDSGVEWLGEIPAHWEVKRLKYLVPDITVGIVVTPAKYYVDSGIPCLRSLNISSGLIQNSNLVFISAETNEIHKKSKIYTEDIVIVRTGLAGTAAIVTSEYNEANCIDLLIVRKSPQVLTQYLHYYLGSHPTAYQVMFSSVGAIQAHYNTSTLAQLLLTYPPLSEQQQIAQFLDRETAKIDTLITKTRTSIDYLKEYRTALISAAVTGKIDVRQTQGGDHTEM